MLHRGLKGRAGRNGVVTVANVHEYISRYLPAVTAEKQQSVCLHGGQMIVLPPLQVETCS